MADEPTRARPLEAVVGGMVERVSSNAVSPAGSWVTGVNVALAAALVAKSSRRSSVSLRSAAATAAQADSLRDRALQLAARNAAAYERAAGALAEVGAPNSGRDHGGNLDQEIQEALTASADSLMALLAVATDVCLLASFVCESAQPKARPDAAVAAVQAESAGRAAGHLIEINLLEGGSEARRADLHDALVTASRATERALALV
jgi:methenyltetrahydrofolate cyclohydrolase